MALAEKNLPREPHPLEYGSKVFRPEAVWQDDKGVAINAHGGGVLYHGGTYYWFGEHKVAGGAGNTAQVGVHVYSSTDLYSWKDGGIALQVSDDPQSEIARGCVIERPKVLFNRRTGKFVMWFHLELKGQGYNAARSGVAVADQPTGPYRYLYSLRPNAGIWASNITEKEKQDKKLQGWMQGGQMARDMTLFQDDDGKAYHFYSSEDNVTMDVSLLSDDYTKPAGQYARILIGRSREAPAVFKRNGRYYFITSACTGWSPNAATVAVADSIWGPWRELGNPCAGTNPWNNLGPDKTFGGQSTFVLPIGGRPSTFIALFDEWRPHNAIDGRYIWLPLEFDGDQPVIRWRDEWRLDAPG